MKNRYSLIFLFIIGFTTVGWGAKIVYPWRATTAIVKSGETFEVWVNADKGETVNSVILQGPYNTLTTKKNVETGNWIYDKISLNTYNTKITVTVPVSAPADRYDIVLNTSGGQEVSSAAVKVIKEYKTSYYILHFSDIHAFQEGYNTTLERLSTIIDISNIIDPEIVFNTGDSMYRPTEDRMNQFFVGNTSLHTKGLNKLNAATFTVAGNHDYDLNTGEAGGLFPEKSNWWNTWWGLQAYNFTYGNGRFMVINDGWVGFNPADQIADATSWLNAVGIGNFRLGAAHIKDTKVIPFDKSVNLGILLVGHNHFIAKENPALLNNKPIQYVVNSIRDNIEFNLYRVDGKNGNCVPVSGSTAQVVAIENPDDKNSPSLYKPKLTLSFSKTNDGTNATNTATIVNRLNFPVLGARVRFVMPLGSLYSVTKGKIDQVFDGNSVQIVDVHVDIDANSTNIIDITPHQIQ